MRSLKLVIKLSLAILFSVSTTAMASNYRDQIIDPYMKMEASVPCADGFCGMQTGPYIPNKDDFKALAHKVHLLDPNGKDPRVRLPKTGQEGKIFAPIGGVMSEEYWVDENGDEIPERWGTGFLVSPCHVLTNHHVAFSPGKSPLEQVVYFGFGVDPATGGDFEGMVQARVAAMGKYPGPVEADWALLEVNPCVGADYNLGWFDVVQLPREKKSVVANIAGFYSDIKERVLHLWGQKDCRATRHFGSWHHNCAATAGSSGSPLFYIGEDGMPKVFALNQGVNKGFSINQNGKMVLVEECPPEGTVIRDEKLCYNIAVDMTISKEMYAAIKTFALPAIAKYGNSNPLQKVLHKEQRKKSSPQRNSI